MMNSHFSHLYLNPGDTAIVTIETSYRGETVSEECVTGTQAFNLLKVILLELWGDIQTVNRPETYYADWFERSANSNSESEFKAKLIWAVNSLADATPLKSNEIQACNDFIIFTKNLPAESVNPFLQAIWEEGFQSMTEFRKNINQVIKKFNARVERVVNEGNNTSSYIDKNPIPKRDHRRPSKNFTPNS